jgi:hypothetical protein
VPAHVLRTLVPSAVVSACQPINHHMRTRQPESERMHDYIVSLALRVGAA